MNKRSQPDKGMIFDFNGTLFQDSLQQENAWRIFACQTLQRTITDSELQKYIHGRSNDSILRFLIGKPLSAKEILTLSEEKEKLYRRLCIEQLSFNLAPGAEALLTNLKLRNIPRAIGT
ncbi:MAG: HAD family phosphatase, partial [Oenococcus sp.]